MASAKEERVVSFSSPPIHTSCSVYYLWNCTVYIFFHVLCLSNKPAIYNSGRAYSLLFTRRNTCHFEMLKNSNTQTTQHCYYYSTAGGQNGWENDYYRRTICRIGLGERYSSACISLLLRSVVWALSIDGSRREGCNEAILGTNRCGRNLYGRPGGSGGRRGSCEHSDHSILLRWRCSGGTFHRRMRRQDSPGKRSRKSVGGRCANTTRQKTVMQTVLGGCSLSQLSM
mmetsp:Transcript_19659/g.31680  ORF Transcript_19659/g.31680 Transcript_19659/m.31680 type:complete len:228 (-) Transcript_19659:56-739(-)